MKKCCSIDLSVLNTRFPTGVSRYTALVAKGLLLLSQDAIGWFTTGTIDPLLDEIQAGGALCKSINHLPFEFPVHNLEETSKQLSAILEIEEIDAHFSPYYPYLAQTRYPCFLTIFDLLPLRHPEWFSNEKVRSFFDGPMRQSAGRTAHIFAISEATRQDIHEIYGIPLDRITVTHLAPTIAPSIMGAKTPLIPEPYFLCVGTLEPRKNLERTVMAFEQFVGEHPDSEHRLMLVGAYGWKSGSLLRRIEQLGHRVCMMGYLSDQQLATCYLHADTVLFASLAEGFGLPVIEAIECGVPVVTSRLSSMPEVGGDIAIYCNPLDAESICDAMERSLDPAVRQRVKDLTAAHLSSFSWEKTASITFEKICAIAC